MNALIPHKDTLFFLAGLQKKIISILNSAGEVLIYPQFPLFAFSENEISSGMSSCNIECPETKNDSAVFPVTIEYKESTVKLFISFAKTADGSKMPQLKLSGEIKNAFPKRERIFRTAEVLLSSKNENKNESSWQVFNDKWNKII